MNNMTDKEVLNLAVEWFKGINEQMERTHTGNFSHYQNTIRSLALHSADFIETHLKED